MGQGTVRTAMVTSPRTGRRPGDSGARDAILAASQTVFAERGYDRATIRTPCHRRPGLGGRTRRPALLPGLGAGRQPRDLRRAAPVGEQQRAGHAGPAAGDTPGARRTRRDPGAPDAGLRATLVASQLIGLALTRYLFRRHRRGAGRHPAARQRRLQSTSARHFSRPAWCWAPQPPYLFGVSVRRRGAVAPRECLLGRGGTGRRWRRRARGGRSTRSA